METVNRQQAYELLGVRDRQFDRYIAEGKVNRIDKGQYSCVSIRECLVGKKMESDTSDHRAVKLEQDRLKNELLQIEIEKENGTLVKRDEYEGRVADLARKTRDAIFNIIPRSVPLLAAETDPAKIQSILDGEIRAALESLKQYMTDED
jgi:hypothetical protein